MSEAHAAFAVERLKALARSGKHPDRIVAIQNGAPVTHAQFVDAVSKWQHAFQTQTGSRVAFYFVDTCDFLAALFGAWHAGKIAVLAGDAQPSTLARLSKTVDCMAGDLPDSIEPSASGAPVLYELDPANTRLEIYTSGSSGEPVALAKTLVQLQAEVDHIEEAFGSDARDASVFATVSHQHMFGLLFQALWPLATGRVIHSRRLEYPEQIAASLAKGTSLLVSSPAHLKRLPDLIDWSAARRGLKMVFSSGGPLPSDASQRTLDLLGVVPTEIYGSSETGALAWRKQSDVRSGWHMLPNARWKIEDGQLHVQSPQIVDPGWWNTSDKAETANQEEHGTFILKGRADRIVKIEEKRVSLSGIERLLNASAHIDQARALALKGEGGHVKEIVVVAVLAIEGDQRLHSIGKRAFVDSLKAELLSEIERIALPRRFRFVSHMPADTQGKTSEAQLARLFAQVAPVFHTHRLSDNKAQVAMTVTPDLRVFEGHFDGMPILPGVAQLDWAISAAKSIFNLGRSVVRIEALKFLAPIVPPTELQLQLDLERVGAKSDQIAKVTFKFQSHKGAHSSGRVYFEDASGV